MNTTMVDQNGTVSLARRFDSSSDLLPQVIVESPSDQNVKVNDWDYSIWTYSNIMFNR